MYIHSMNYDSEIEQKIGFKKYLVRLEIDYNYQFFFVYTKMENCIIKKDVNS